MPIPYETAHIFVSNMMPNIIRSFNERILNKGYTPNEIKIRKELLEIDLARVYYAHELSISWQGYQKQMPTIEINFTEGSLKENLTWIKKIRK